ncbi:MAG: histidine phosphatase family protein [Cellulosilyticaceae bacterium]
MKITWIRHGMTTENEKQTYYGALEATLTERGKQQVKYLKQKEYNNCKIYVSPKERCLQTARGIFEIDNFETDVRLKERNMGLWEGMNYQKIKSDHKKKCDLWDKDWISYVVPEGESAKNQYDRVKDFVKMLENKQEDAVVVAHAGTIKMALSYMLGDTIELFWKFKIEPATVVETICEEDFWYIDSITHTPVK